MNLTLSETHVHFENTLQLFWLATLATLQLSTGLPCHLVDMSSQLERSDSEKTMVLGSLAKKSEMLQPLWLQLNNIRLNRIQLHSIRLHKIQLRTVDPAEFAASESDGDQQAAEDPDDPTYRVLGCYGHRIVVEGEVSPMAMLLGSMLAQQLQVAGHQGMGATATSSSLSRGRSSMEIDAGPEAKPKPKSKAKAGRKRRQVTRDGQ